MKQRSLDLQNGDEVIAEIDHIQANGYEQGGNWNLTQICDHLAKTMRGGIEGFGFRLPWIVRVTLGQFLINKMLRARRSPSLIVRVPAPKVVVPTVKPSKADDPAVIDACKDLVRQCTAFEGPLPPHPAAEKVSLAEWKEMMWIHASHHLGFLWPRSESKGT